MAAVAPYQLLEINLISAQDLAKSSRSMKTYAMAWVHPDRKLTTRVDANGGTNPTWNDKFVFRVDNQFLHSDNAAIMIEIYALHWFRDVHVGTVRVLVGNLIPPTNQNHIGMRFVALQVRRPSGRPQGILNVGVTVLDSTMRSMPLYTQLSASAVGYQKFMGHDGPSTMRGDLIMTTQQPQQRQEQWQQLYRSKSDKSSFLGMGASSSLLDENATFFLPKPNGSIINGAETSDKKGRTNTGKKKKGKVIYDKPLSIVDGVAPSDLSLAMKLKAQEGKTDSLLSYSSSIKNNKAGKKGKNVNTYTPCRSDVGVPPLLRQIGNKKFGSEVGMPTKITKEIDNNKSPTPVAKPKQPYYKAGGYPIAKDFAAGSVWSESEVGPSPSEVAAAIAEDSKYRQYDEGRSSMLEDKWSMQDSEGVRTKLERWRTQMPPPSQFDQYSGTSGSSSTMFRGGGGAKNRRRPADAVSGGKFSCFGNLCGYECTIVCGSDTVGPKNKNGPTKQRVGRAPSLDSVSTYF